MSSFLFGMHFFITRTWILSLFVGYRVPDRITQPRLVLDDQRVPWAWVVDKKWQRAAYSRIGLQLFLYLGLLSSGAFAQFPFSSNLRLTTANGLPHNAITGVEQDKAGFIWLATADGLARYDGRLVFGTPNGPVTFNPVAIQDNVYEPPVLLTFLQINNKADDYLTKPVHVDELVLRLDNMLTRQANLRAHLYRQLAAPSVITDEPVVDAFVRQLHQVIEARLDDGTFSIDELAQTVAMSRRTLNRKLTATANLSASDFIRHYRLQRATQMLQAGRSISDTAYGVGFESPAYFATVFKQTYH